MTAETDLELYFATADATWGLHGSGFEGSAATVWDEAREAREHNRRWLAAHNGIYDDIRRVTLLAETFRARAPEEWTVTMVVFTPRRWPDVLASHMIRKGRNEGSVCGNLTGMLLASERLAARLVAKDIEPTALAMLNYADTVASNLATESTFKRRFFEPLKEEAEGKLQDALHAYRVSCKVQHKRELEGLRGVMR